MTELPRFKHHSEESLAEPTTSFPKLYLGEIKAGEICVLWNYSGNSAGI